MSAGIESLVDYWLMWLASGVVLAAATLAIVKLRFPILNRCVNARLSLWIHLASWVILMSGLSHTHRQTSF